MPPILTAYAPLIAAIVLEVIGTTALKASDSFTRLWPTLLMAVSYAGSFYALTFAMRVIPMGVAYAIWGGLGMVLISLSGLFVFGQKLDAPACLGMGLIVAGVLVINLFSQSAGH